LILLTVFLIGFEHVASSGRSSYETEKSQGKFHRISLETLEISLVQAMLKTLKVLTMFQRFHRFELNLKLHSKLII
jgi:uncharacterized membrane protein